MLYSPDETKKRFIRATIERIRDLRQGRLIRNEKCNLTLFRGYDVLLPHARLVGPLLVDR